MFLLFYFEQYKYYFEKQLPNITLCRFFNSKKKHNKKLLNLNFFIFIHFFLVDLDKYAQQNMDKKNNLKKIILTGSVF